MQMPAGEVDLDGIPPTTLHGIELYLGATTAPMRYTGGRNASSCGTILLWSRGPDTDPIQSRGPRVSLDALVRAVQVYTADQVDQRAMLDPSKHVEVEYPPALFAEHIPGQVIAEFVVDPTGHIELDTFGVVSSTNRLFSEAVRHAIEEMLYKPAQVEGRAVRQLVHQPFKFAPPGKPSAD
jgi:TonB family protein